MTPTIFGSTVGYSSDSLASCYFILLVRPIVCTLFTLPSVGTSACLFHILEVLHENVAVVWMVAIK